MSLYLKYKKVSNEQTDDSSIILREDKFTKKEIVFHGKLKQKYS